LQPYKEFVKNAKSSSAEMCNRGGQILALLNQDVLNQDGGIHEARLAVAKIASGVVAS
jgi:hypothetical protein